MIEYIHPACHKRVEKLCQVTQFEVFTESKGLIFPFMGKKPQAVYNLHQLNDIASLDLLRKSVRPHHHYIKILTSSLAKLDKKQTMLIILYSTGV